jgi:hypothetical protein
MPWLGCYGNHEQVCQGVGLVTASWQPGPVRKPVGPPSGLDPTAWRTSATTLSSS